MKRNNSFRPWWWWLNPWLYIQRRDRAYMVALDSLQELSVEQYAQKRDAGKRKPWNNLAPVTDDDVWVARLVCNHMVENTLTVPDPVQKSVPFVADLLAKHRVRAYNEGLATHSPIALNVGFEAGLVAGRDIAKHEMESQQ